MAKPGATKTLRHEPQQALGPSNLLQSFSAGSPGTVLALQQAVGNEAVGQLLRSDPGDPEFGANDEFSQGQSDLKRSKILRAQSRNGSANSRAEQDDARAPSSVTRPAPRVGQSRALLVPDDARQIESGQMRKSEFLNKLRESVSRAAEEELRGTIWSATDCAYIDCWFGHYESRDSRHVEGALRKYAPETVGVISATDYIPILTARVRKGIAQWTRTDEVDRRAGMFLYGVASQENIA